MTAQQQLNEVNAAITSILTKGQSHSAEGRSSTRADLAQLFKERTRLQTAVAREAAGGIVVRAGTAIDG